MNKNNLQSHLLFTKQQRGGILLLLLLIIALLYVYYFVDFGDDIVLDASSPKMIHMQQYIDSLEKVELEERKPKQYRFNPNYITDFKAYTLGLTTEEYDRLQEYRKKGKWINSAKDFKRVTKVSDSLLLKLTPLFKFPDWITSPKPKKPKYINSFSEKSFTEKSDLNEATIASLQKVSGIGPVISKRIIAYREKLGGFSDDIQLFNVYGLDSNVTERLLAQFTVKKPKEIIKMNVNLASASDIATIPGISFEMAKTIWEFRILREYIDDLSELEKIEGLSARKIQLIRLYLSVE